MKNVSKTSGGKIGFFGHTEGATIWNVKLHITSNWSVGGDYVGGLVGYADYSQLYWNLVTSSSKTITNSGGNGTGGVIGRADNCSIYDCDNGTSSSNGLAVKSANTTDANLGGCVGVYWTCNSWSMSPGTNSDGTGSGNVGLGVMQCDNYGNLTLTATSSSNARNPMGGIVGRMGQKNGTAVSTLRLYSCRNYGSLTYTGTTQTGGSAGNIGGVAGRFDEGLIGANCVHDLYNSGTITTKCTQTGGIAGVMYNCSAPFGLRNEGTVSTSGGANYVGGIVGWCNVVLSGVSNTGSVSGTGTNIGGIVGCTENVLNGAAHAINYWRSTPMDSNGSRQTDTYSFTTTEPGILSLVWTVSSEGYSLYTYHQRLFPLSSHWNLPPE